jgi:glutamine synthetase
MTTYDHAKEAQVAAVLEGWQAEGIRNVRFELPDMHGISRSKLIPLKSVADYARTGLNMYGGTVVLDSRSDVVPGSLYNEEVGYGDQLLWPDPTTACRVPWAERTGRFICDAAWLDGRPLEAAPRYVLKRVLDRWADLGIEPLMGIEYEFYLLDGTSHTVLFDGHHIFNTIRNTWVPVVEEIVEQMDRCGIQIITANCEYSSSQWEINYKPAVGMAAADQAFTFKNAVKEIAHRAGLVATFMSKPFSEAAGSGAHLHVSMLSRESGDNALFDPSASHGLSKLGRHFLAGQLHHGAATYALLAPTVNCLRRRRRHTFSPTNVSWGVEDRSAFVRLKGEGRPSIHFENRAPSAMSNPYLAAAAVLAAGLIGVLDELELPPSARTPAEDDENMAPLPASLPESLRIFEEDKRLGELLGEEFVTAYDAMRRYELERFADHVTDWEREEYLDVY